MQTHQTPPPTSLIFPRIYLILLLIVSVYTVVNAAAALAIKLPAVGDAEASYMVIRNMEKGGPFNTLEMINPDDIAESYHYFLTWWTPGQYMIPFTLTKIFALPLWISSWCVVVLGVVLGISGMYFVMREMKLSSMAIYIGLLLIMTQLYFQGAFLRYGGATVLEFGIVPWAILAALRLNHFSLTNLIIFLSVSVVGFLFKSSYLILFAAISVYLGFATTREFRGKYIPDIQLFKSIPAMRRLLVTAICWGLFLLVVKLAFLQHGESPASVTRATHNTYPEEILPFERYLFPVVGPVVDFLWLPAELLGRVVGTSSLMILFGHLVCVVLMAVILFGIIRSKSLSREYKEMVLSVYIVFVLIFGWVYLRDAPISVNSRHFRPVALLLVPGIAVLLSHFQSRFAAGAVLLILAGNMFGNGFFLLKQQQLAKERNIVVDGHVHLKSLSEDLAVLKRLDESFAEGSALFYITPWNRALDFSIQRNRVVPVGIAGTGIPELRRINYFDRKITHPGVVEHLIVVTDLDSDGESLNGIFTSYDSFELIETTNRSKFWKGVIANEEE